MPNVRGKKDYINLTKGLVTEVNPLNFPEGATVDELNMNVDFSTLSRIRRGGVQSSPDDEVKLWDSEQTQGVVFKPFLWKNAGNTETSILALQVGRLITFWGATDPEISGLGFIRCYDLINSAATGSLTAETRCQFSQVGGRLMVVRSDINPTLIDYDVSSPFTVQSVDIRIRDTQGVDDNLANTLRPGTLSEEHQYNLYNQGWYQSRRSASSGTGLVDPVTLFFGDTATYPSNADISYLGLKEDGSGDLRFDSPTLKDQTLGNTPAPKGHYIFSAWDIDREARRTSKLTDGSTFSDLTDEPTRIRVSAAPSQPIQPPSP